MYLFKWTFSIEHPSVAHRDLASLDICVLSTSKFVFTVAFKNMGPKI